MKSMDKRYNFIESELELSKKWKENKTFEFQNTSGKKNFTIMMPPPNVTGSLHIGHALTFTLQDILIRYNKKLGKNVLWQPGTDHAGIATEIIVEKKLINEEKKSRKDIGRQNFIEKIWAWKEESGSKIIEQLNRLGAAIDWNISKFTMDPEMSEVVNKVFVRLYNNGLIYKSKKLVNWDPQLQTAVSDLEVQQKESLGKLWFLKYKIKDSNQFVEVATTRPETMFGDSAIAIHPNNKKLSKLIGKFAEIPISGKIIPIIGDQYADPKKGSGAVKITPAHDFNDFIIGKKHKLEVINIFQPDAKLNKNVPNSFVGLDRFTARKKIVKLLQNEKLLTKIQDNKMTIPVGERSGIIIEPYLTDQWFLNTKKLCIPVEKSLKKNKIIFYPKSWVNTFKHWIKNIEPWCISRQIWWGHRIPIWYTNSGKVVPAQNEREAKKFVKKNFSKNVVISHQESDVLDTWFSSSLWTFSTLGWPQKKTNLKNHYPSDVLVTGFDIIFFWVARMIMMGFKFLKKNPFKNIYIHPLIRDEIGNKMSKSKGNVVDPIDLINEYGADALRLTMVSLSTQGKDIKFSNKSVENSRNFITKLWNAARFAQFHDFKIEKLGEVKIDVNFWIIHKLQTLRKKIFNNLNTYKFNLITQDLYQFVWNDFCDFYIEFSKYHIVEKNHKIEISKIFSFVFNEILNLLNPIIPFVSEKISLDLDYTKKGLYAHEFSKNQIKIKKSAVQRITTLINLIKKIRSEKKDLNTDGKYIELLVLRKKKINWVDDNFDLLKSMCSVKKIIYREMNSKNLFIISGVKFCITDKKSEQPFDKEQLSQKINFFEKELLYFEKKISNKDFINKAPKKIVESEKEKLEEVKKTLKLLKGKNV